MRFLQDPRYYGNIMTFKNTYVFFRKHVHVFQKDVRVKNKSVSLPQEMEKEPSLSY